MCDRNIPASAVYATESWADQWLKLVGQHGIW